MLLLLLLLLLLVQQPLLPLLLSVSRSRSKQKSAGKVRSRSVGSALVLYKEYCGTRTTKDGNILTPKGSSSSSTTVMSSSPYVHVTTTSSSLSPVPHGSSYISHSTATLGPLSLPCTGEINSQLWGAGATFAAHLYNLPPSSPSNPLYSKPDVLELGAGTGLLTDLPSSLAFLSSSIALNRGVLPPDVEVEAEALPWGEEGEALVDDLLGGGVDLILGADLHYNPAFFGPLLRTVERVCEKREVGGGRETRVLIATEQRWEAVNEEWERALAESRMDKVEERDLITPTSAYEFECSVYELNVEDQHEKLRTDHREGSRAFAFLCIAV